MRYAKLCLVSALAISPLFGCGTKGFAPAAKVQSLRILAVQKDPPYGAAPETEDASAAVHLKVLYWDGKTDPFDPRPLAPPLWLGGKDLPCINPLGDLYYECYSVFEQEAMRALEGGIGIGSLFGEDASTGGASGADDGATSGEGSASAEDAASSEDAGLDAGALSSSNDGSAPDDAAVAATDGQTSALPAERIAEYSIPLPTRAAGVTKDPGGVTPYGLAYAFVSLCAGTFALDTAASGLPFACLDSNQNKLSEDDFVTAYSAIYFYGQSDWTRLANHNPVVDGFVFEGTQVASGDTTFKVPHVARCTESDEDNCPGHSIKSLIVGPAEPDPDATGSNGEQFTEQMWVSYFASQGSFKHDSRLVNDATKGWNDDHGSEWRAPSVSGPARLWAVVHDNRGGVAWTHADVVVDP